jgi:hypothetical protein
MFHHAIARIRHGRFRAIMLLAAFAACGALAAAGHSADRASASYSFCTQDINPGDHCDGSATNLRAVIAHGTLRVCAGATQNGAFYGSYSCGDTGYAEHCYGTYLAPRIHNGDSPVQYMTGQVYHDSETCP